MPSGILGSASLAAATVNVAQRIERLALRVEDEQLKAELKAIKKMLQNK